MAQPIAHLDPDSRRGQELARELTVLLDDLGEAVRLRKQQAAKQVEAAQRDAA